MRHALPAVIVMMLVVASAPDAQGATCVGPPGQGAIDQYCELVPAGGGPGSAQRSRPRELPSETRRALRRAGADGRAVQALAQNSPAPAVRRSADRDDDGPGDAPPAEQASSSSLIDVVRSAATSDTTARAWSPWALLALTLGAIGATWMRHRGNF